MSKCDVYIADKETSYEGDYTIEDGCLEVEVFNYSSEKSNDSIVKYQEMLVADLRNKQFMFSNAFHFCGLSYGLTQYEKFRTKFYIKTGIAENAEYLKPDMQISKITIYHPMLAQCYQNPCLLTTISEEETNYKIINDSKKEIIDIQTDNIEKIEFGGMCRYTEKNDRQLITIESENYAKIYMTTPVSYEDVLEYINEFDVFLNAYCPTGLRSYKTHITSTEDKTYDVIHRLLEKNKYHKKIVQMPIKMDFYKYIEKMYKTLNYRCSDNRNKFIPLDFKKPTSIEDQYTYYFRYIDLYMGEYLKKKTGNDVSNYERLSYFIDEYKHLFEPEDITDIDKLKKELNSLRNHYIHEGYYLPNNQFSVTEKRKILYYKDMDYHWLYRITQALKEGAYIILYTKVLNLDIDDRKLKYALRTIK